MEVEIDVAVEIGVAMFVFRRWSCLSEFGFVFVVFFIYLCGFVYLFIGIYDVSIFGAVAGAYCILDCKLGGFNFSFILLLLFCFLCFCFCINFWNLGFWNKSCRYMFGVYAWSR